MCNLYSITKGPQAIRDFARAMRGDVGNLEPLPGVFPDYFAPIVRNGAEGRELVIARWGMPSPSEIVKGKNRDSGVTNIHNVASPHWKRWLGVESRCVVPFVLFRERGAPRWLPAAGMVRLRREPAARLLSRASGRAGRQSARSRKGRRRMTSTPF